MVDYASFSKYIMSGDLPVEEFSRACKDLAGAKIVTAERKIAELLKIIATSSKLQDVVRSSAKGFDFNASLAKAKVQSGKKLSLMVPATRNELIAFTVSLLFAFDTHAINLADFLDDYFYTGNGATFAFVSFVKSVIFPFESAVLLALNDAPENIRFESEEMSAPPPGLLPPAVAEDIVKRIGSIAVGAEKNRQFSAEGREAIVTLCEALVDAVDEGRDKHIRACVIGLRSELKHNPGTEKLSEKASELDETLKTFGV